MAIPTTQTDLAAHWEAKWREEKQRAGELYEAARFAAAALSQVATSSVLGEVLQERAEELLEVADITEADYPCPECLDEGVIHTPPPYAPPHESDSADMGGTRPCKCRGGE